MLDQINTVFFTNSEGRIYYLKECLSQSETNRAYNKVMLLQEDCAYNSLIGIIAHRSLSDPKRFIAGIEFKKYDFDLSLNQNRRVVHSFLDERLHNRFATLFNLPQFFDVPIHISCLSPRGVMRV